MPFFSRKKKGDRGTPPSTSRKSEKQEDKKMPLFRRQSEKCHNRQQDQEFLAMQDPEPRYDLSSCELAKIPSGAFELCKVLRKEVLLLHDNWVQELGGAEEMESLLTLKVLDAHNNAIKSLPNEIEILTNLQVLDLSHNKLKTLPDSFGHLRVLQSLKIKKNRFKSFPQPICQLKCLRTLDISENEITSLPKELCHVRALETLVLDVDEMTYPTIDTCAKGTGAIMMFLCGASDEMYEHPSKYWLRMGASLQGTSDTLDGSKQMLTQLEARSMEGLQAYQNAVDQKKKDSDDLHKILAEESEAQTRLAALASANQEKMLARITQDEEQISEDLDVMINKKETEKKEFLAHLSEVERGTSQLLAELLDYNAKAKETEELLEELEQAKMEEDKAFAVSWEEYQNVRRNEVLATMQMMLTDSTGLEQRRLQLEKDKDDMIQDVLEQELLEEGQVESMIDFKAHEHDKLVAKLADEERLQKAAVEALLFVRDATHSRLQSQMGVIENELAQLSKLEMESRAKRSEIEVNMLCDQRMALSALYADLLEEENQRKAELKKRLLEIEQQKEEGQTDYWLVQYQRLLDWKPQGLIDKETQLEKAVKEILEVSGAGEYIPMFARHRITIETMQTLTDEDLRKMGIHEIGLRRAILKNVESMDINIKSAPEKLKKLLREPSIVGVMPTAPAEVGPEAEPEVVAPALPPSLASRQSSVTARGLHSECAICMDNESNIIFLTCGHVCTCVDCARSLTLCPLCRGEIIAKIHLTLANS